MKLNFRKHGCDKSRHGYESVYESAFDLFRNFPMNILEVGIFRGASLAAWLDYFPSAQITGLDTFQRIDPKDVPILKHPRVHYKVADSREVKLNEEFDIIIDDGAHTHRDQLETFKNLWPYTDWYFIEDVWALDCMSATERKHKWLEKDGFSDDEYRQLLAAVSEHDVIFHDLRKGHCPDSFIIEVRR